MIGTSTHTFALDNAIAPRSWQILGIVTAPDGDRRRTPRDSAFTAAERLQLLCAAGGTPSALLDFDSAPICNIQPQRGTVECEQELPALADELIQRYSYCQPLHARHASGGLLRTLPLEQLCWHLGARIALRHGLLPWVRRMGSYRLVRWPDFGASGEEFVHRALATQLVDEPKTLEQLRALAPARSVDAFLNAATMCAQVVDAAGAFARHRASASASA